MKPYEDIMKYFGFRTQLKKLNEECFEFIEAVDNLEDLEAFGLDSGNGEKTVLRFHVIEEMGDMLILLSQFIVRYGIKEDELNEVMDYKLDRTITRIENNYYKNKK